MKQKTALNPKPGILDKSAYGAGRPWADGDVLIKREAAAPSAISMVAPTRIGQGPLREKLGSSRLRSQAHYGGSLPFFLSACLPSEWKRAWASAKSLINYEMGRVKVWERPSVPEYQNKNRRPFP